MSATRLVELLAAARGEGQCFEDAWPPATLAAVAHASSWHRDQWLQAFNATRDAWRAGYDREAAPRQQRAVLALLDPDEREALTSGPAGPDGAALDAEVDADRAAA